MQFEKRQPSGCLFYLADLTCSMVTCNLGAHAMSSAAKQKSSTSKVQAHRQRQRAKGMRLLQIWVPDVRSAAFRKEAHRQSALVAASPQAKDDQDFIDAISWWNNE